MLPGNLLALENDIEDAEITAKTLFPTFDGLSDARKAVLVNMAFNLGAHRLAGFARLREAVANGHFEAAAGLGAGRSHGGAAALSQALILQSGDGG